MNWKMRVIPISAYPLVQPFRASVRTCLLRYVTSGQRQKSKACPCRLTGPCTNSSPESLYSSKRKPAKRKRSHSVVFYDSTPHTLVKMYQCFQRANCLGLQDTFTSKTVITCIPASQLTNYNK